MVGVGKLAAIKKSIYLSGYTSVRLKPGQNKLLDILDDLRNNE